MQEVSTRTRCLNPPRKLNEIGEQLWPLYEKSMPVRLVDNNQDGDDVSGLLEDLQQAVNDYMVR